MKKATLLTLKLILFSLFFGLVHTTTATAQNALDFDGTDDFVAITNTAALNPSKFTMATWIKWDRSGTTVDFICGKGNETMELHTGGASSNNIRFIPTPGVYLDGGLNTITPGTWVHLAVVYDPALSLAKMYVDGTDVPLTNNGPNPLSTPVASSTDNLIIGSRGNLFLPFLGQLDEFQFWDRALSQAEIQAYNATCGINTTVDGPLINLHFNQGIANGNNTAITTVSDASGFNNHASMYNFALNASTSNFVPSSVATTFYTENTTTVNALDSYTWPHNGATYTVSGVYTGTTTNCVTEKLNLTITSSVVNLTDTTVCGSFTWANNGQTYTVSGIYTGNPIAGVTQLLNLNITTPTDYIIYERINGGSYTWPHNGVTYSTSGIYTGTDSNCVTPKLHLTILTRVATNIHQRYEHVIKFKLSADEPSNTITNLIYPMYLHFRDNTVNSPILFADEEPLPSPYYVLTLAGATTWFFIYKKQINFVDPNLGPIENYHSAIDIKMDLFNHWQPVSLPYQTKNKSTIIQKVWYAPTFYSYVEAVDFEGLLKIESVPDMIDFTAATPVAKEGLSISTTAVNADPGTYYLETIGDCISGNNIRISDNFTTAGGTFTINSYPLTPSMANCGNMLVHIRKVDYVPYRGNLPGYYNYIDTQSVYLPFNFATSVCADSSLHASVNAAPAGAYQLVMVNNANPNQYITALSTIINHSGGNLLINSNTLSTINFPGNVLPEYLAYRLLKDGEAYTAFETAVVKIKNCSQVNSTQNALAFDGFNDDRISIPHAAALNPSKFTIATWIKWDRSGTALDVICSKGDSIMQIQTGAGISNNIRFIPTPGVYLDGGVNTITPGTWVHLAVVYDPTQSLAKMYVNGVEIPLTLSGTNPLSTAVASSTDNFIIGIRQNLTNPFDGQLDEFQLWDRVLSPAEIQALTTCGINTSASGLLVNLHFNQGIAHQNNNTITTVTDASGFNNHANILSMAMNGNTSNFVESNVGSSLSTDNVTTITACDSYVWNGTTYTSSGVYVGTTTNCVTEVLDLTITPSSNNVTTISVCDSYVWNGTTYTASGIYTGTTTNCVTEVLDLTITPSSNNVTTISVCDSYVWNGTTYTTTGIYTGTTTNCVTEVLDLTITSSTNNVTTISACDSYVWNGTTYTTTGIYAGTTTNCVTEVLDLTITPSSNNVTTISACDSYVWNGTTYTASGIYTGTTTNCVTEVLDLTITPSSNNITTISACDSYVWNGTTYTASGIYTGTTTNCVTEVLDLTITPSSNNVTTISACDSYVWNGTTYTTSGIYTGTTTNCVTEVLDLTITPSSNNITTISACDSYVWNGTTYTASGIYTGTTTNCLTEVLDLTITPSSNNVTTISACDSYVWNGTTYTTSGIYTGTTTNCVTEVLDLTITPSSNNVITISACDSYVWNGTTYTSTGIYTGTTTNCVTEMLDLTIIPSTNNVTTISACDSYVWNGTTYTTSGIYTGTTTNCVTEVLDLTITSSSNNVTTISVCDSYVWNGTTYTTSGIYTGTTTNCLTEVLDLTITPSSNNVTTISACDSYVWNGTTYTSSGLYNGTTTNCVTDQLDLTITATPSNNVTLSGATLTATAVGADYQWLICETNGTFTPINLETNQTFVPTSNGNYAVEVTNNGCMATSACISVTTVDLATIDKTEFSYYPNPVTDKLILTHSDNISSVKFVDISGREVKTIHVNSNTAEINVAELPSAMYFVTITFENNVQTEIKVIKSN